MTNRVVRLSISPEEFPEVRRVIDFGGRHTLHDVHELMQRTLHIGDDDHLYAFFLSGRYWDRDSEYVDPRTDGRRADRALLFRLGLRAGQEFVYLYDYGDEHRYSLTVVSVAEAEAPLPAPLVIESVGEAPRPFEDEDHDVAAVEEAEQAEEAEEIEGHHERTEHDDPQLREPMKLASALLARIDALEAAGNDDARDQTQPLQALANSALALMAAIDGNLKWLSDLDRETDFLLLDQLLLMPARLSKAHETDLAMRVAEALRFCAPDDMNGEVALAYVDAGDRDGALARVLVNLETATQPFVAENKAGDVYRALAEYDAAEAYYRRALAIAQTPSERQEATVHIASLLVETGREADAASFVAQQRGAPKAQPSGLPQLLSVGRNEPCPCGSGNKYKKCHGA